MRAKRRRLAGIGTDTSRRKRSSIRDLTPNGKVKAPGAPCAWGLLATDKLSFDQPGGYVRLMDKEALGRPRPGCGGKVEKLQYLGGTCYLCPACQAL